MTYNWDCVRIDKAGAVWLNLRPLRGRLPKWPTGADCKSAGYAFDGSNPSPTTILRSKRSGDEECRAKVPRSGRRRAGATAKLRASTRQAATFHFRLRTRGAGLPIYDLAAGGPKFQIKSNARDAIKKKEAGHYSGLSMRTKR